MKILKIHVWQELGVFRRCNFFEIDIPMFLRSTWNGLLGAFAEVKDGTEILSVLSKQIGSLEIVLSKAPRLKILDLPHEAPSRLASLAKSLGQVH